MDDCLPFKAFLYMEEDSKPEVRRFAMEKPFYGKIKPLIAKLREVYPKLKTKKYIVAWKDEDGDEVLISSDEEVETMFHQCQDSVLKLIVRCTNGSRSNDNIDDGKATAGDGNPAKSDQSNCIHQGITCDGCGNVIVGFRYKCISCDDFDLCARCENVGKHPEHCVVRVPIPNMPLPLMKVTIKKSRKFLKSVASQAYEESKRQRRERGNYNYEPSSNTHAKKESQPSACRNWVQIFGKYLEEFTNLAGDLGRSAEKKPESEATESGTSAATESNVPTNEEISLNPWNLPQEDLEKLHYACKFMRDNALRASLKPLSKAFSKVLEMAATSAEEATAQSPARASSPLREMSARKTNRETSPQSQNKAGEQASQPKEETPKVVQETPKVVQEAPKHSSSGQPQTSNTAPQDYKAMEKPTTSGQVAFDAEAPKYNGRHCDISELINAVSAELTSSASSCSSEGHGSDKAEGWTVIDETMKDMMINPDHFEVSTAADKDKLHEHVPEHFRRIYPTLNATRAYPPLNTATAVLDPNETDVAASAPAATAAPAATTASAPMPPKTEAPPAPKTTNPNQAKTTKPATTAEHIRAQLAPHVEAAVHQMEAMGFSNESGWLTQLLDHNDGNIAKVLDLITPAVPPSK